MKNEFHRILAVFIGGLIVLIAFELIWIVSVADELSIARLIMLLIAVSMGLVLVKVGLRSS